MTNFNNLLLQNHWAYFNQTWHKASLGEGNSCLFKWRALPFSKGRLLPNSENTLMNFKNLLALNHWASFNQTCHKSSLDEGNSSYVQMKGSAFFQGEIIMKLWKYIDRLKKFSSSELRGQFHRNLAQSILEGDSRLFKWRTIAFQWGIITKLWKYINEFENHFFQNHWANSTKLATNHPWVKEIQVYSNEGPDPFPRGDYYDIVKIHWQIWKIIFSKTTEPISTKLGTMHHWEKEIQICSNEGLHPFPRAYNYEIVKIHWWILKIFSSEPIGQFLSCRLCSVVLIFRGG